MLWVNLLIFASATAGHAELQAALINRLHALPLGRKPLRWMRRLHYAAVFAFPVVLIWLAGLTGPRLLLDGRWNETCSTVRGLFITCGVGFVSLACWALRWQLRGFLTPACVISSRTESRDVAAELAQPPAGDGPHSGLTGWRINEIFRLDVEHLEIRLPRLPHAWDGMTIAHLSDLHFVGTPSIEYFRYAVDLVERMNADLICCTGDVLDRQQLRDWLPDTLGRLSAPLGCWFVLGNHDWYHGPEETRAVLSELGWNNVAGRVGEVEHRGEKLLICGTERPWMGRNPELPPLEVGAFRLALSHTPDGLRWARRHGIDLLLAGHNHGGQIVLPVLGPVYSPSLWGVRYAAGTFWRKPTLMHVSRGLAGKEPIRIGCPPEITRIVLRAVR